MALEWHYSLVNIQMARGRKKVPHPCCTSLLLWNATELCACSFPGCLYLACPKKSQTHWDAGHPMSSVNTDWTRTCLKSATGLQSIYAHIAVCSNVPSSHENQLDPLVEKDNPAILRQISAGLAVVFPAMIGEGAWQMCLQAINKKLGNYCVLLRQFHRKSLAPRDNAPWNFHCGLNTVLPSFFLSFLYP